MNSNSSNDLYNLNVATVAPSMIRFSSQMQQQQGGNNTNFNCTSGSNNTNANGIMEGDDGGTNVVAATAASMLNLNDRNNVMMTSADASGGGGAVDAANTNGLQDGNASSSSNNNNNNNASSSTSAVLSVSAVPSSAILNSHQRSNGGGAVTVTVGDLRASRNSYNTTSDDTDEQGYDRRTSKESLASTANDSQSEVLFDTTSGMDAAQKANLLHLLQRQQLQMGNLNMGNGTSVAAMAMMASLQQQQQQPPNNGSNGNANSGTASHRNSMTGSVTGTTTASMPGSLTVGGATDVNSFLMNMNYMNPNTTNNTTNINSTIPTTLLNNPNLTNNNNNNSNNNNNEKGPLLLIPPKKSKNKHKQTFAMKLMNILSIKECHSSIRWMPNGLSFCIVDSKILVEKVLPVYFKEAKYTSFTRKLNRWGFKHYSLPINEASSNSSIADKEMSIYSHDKFRRDDPGLCQTMDGGHRRRNALKEDEKTRQFYSQLKPEVRDLLMQGQLQQQQQQHQQGVGLVAAAAVGEDGTVAGGGGVGMDGFIGTDQLASQAQAIAKQVGPVGGGGGVAATSSSVAGSTLPNSTAGLELQLQQMQAMQLQLMQQQQSQMQQSQQQQQTNQMMDMSYFMTNNAASMLGAAGAGSNGMAAAMGGDAALKNNFLLATANQQGLMGLNMMGGGGGGGGVGAAGGGDNNVNTNAAMAAAAMTAAAQGGQLSNSLGMRRTSLGFMPYLPVSSRRDSLGSVFSFGNNHAFDGKIESTFDDIGGGGRLNSSTAGVAGMGRGDHKEGYEPGTSGGGGDQTSKLDVLQGLISNEQRRQQSLMQYNTSNNDGTVENSEGAYV